MKPQFLIIDDDPDYRSLLSHHVSAKWPQANIRSYDPQASGRLPDSFAGASCDVVLLASSAACPVQMVRFGKNIYATQFHCELDAAGIAERIYYYKHHGYFDPNSAEALIAKTKDVVVEVPQMILKRFVDRYRTSSK